MLAAIGVGDVWVDFQVIVGFTFNAIRDVRRWLWLTDGWPRANLETWFDYDIFVHVGSVWRLFRLSGFQNGTNGPRCCKKCEFYSSFSKNF